jgi:Na+-transporting NADH:ubiquinone oxidoreductase subunit NqrB
VGNAIIWPESPWVVFPLEALAVLVAAAVLLTDRERRAISAVAIASVGLGMVLVVVAANLATAETPRHAIVPMAMARIGILCGLVCGVESVVVRARSRGVARQPRQAVRDAAILTTL